MSRIKKVEIDLVQSIVDKTLNNEEFNAMEWSIYDGEQLIKAGKMIVREVTKNEKKWDNYMNKIKKMWVHEISKHS